MKFENGVVVLEKDETQAEVYTRFREAVLDNLIPLNKAIGFKLTSATDTSIASATDRNQSVIENMIEISNNVGKLIFLPKYDALSNTVLGTSNIINITEQQEKEVTSANAIFTSGGKKVDVLDKSIYLYYPVNKVGVRILAFEAAGVRTMEQNVEKMNELLSATSTKGGSSFFPLNTEHSLIDYVRIIPHTGKGDVRYRLFKGMTDDILTTLWKVYERGAANG
jgi:hypothetical protein